MTTQPAGAVIEATAKTIEVADLNLFYGDFHAVRTSTCSCAATASRR